MRLSREDRGVAGRDSAVGYQSSRTQLNRMSAAQALVHRATLVILNINDFRDIPGIDLMSLSGASRC
jgi:predicted nucleic acid-binding protein